MAFYKQEKEILLKLRTVDEGFSKFIESDYDEKNDLYYIVMKKLDEDLDSLIKNSKSGHLQL